MNIACLLNLDFSKAVCLRPEGQRWIKSPTDSASRARLEREAEASGHTTSVIEVEPGPCFPPLPHLQGEIMYVLEGVFSDANGDYAAGSYILNRWH